VERAPSEIFEFLSDLRNHWRLEPHFVDLEDIGTTGGRVRIKGPLGISREARTRVDAAEPPSTLRGSAEIGLRTRASIRWEIVPAAAGSRVTLTGTVDEASLYDRLLLRLGGRWWLQRIFERALQALARV
jgi:hypothetical protein